MRGKTCLKEEDPGQSVVFVDEFPRAGGFAKIPEFKYCAVRITAGGAAPVQGSFGGGVLHEAATRT